MYYIFMYILFFVSISLTEVVYESVVMSLEEASTHPEYSERLHSLLNSLAQSAVITGMYRWCNIYIYMYNLGFVICAYIYIYI